MKRQWSGTDTIEFQVLPKTPEGGKGSQTIKTPSSIKIAQVESQEDNYFPSRWPPGYSKHSEQEVAQEGNNARQSQTYTKKRGYQPYDTRKSSAAWHHKTIQKSNNIRTTTLERPVENKTTGVKYSMFYYAQIFTLCSSVSLSIGNCSACVAVRKISLPQSVY